MNLNGPRMDGKSAALTAGSVVPSSVEVKSRGSFPGSPACFYSLTKFTLIPPG